MSKQIRVNEYFRLKVKELVNSLDQVHAFIKEHNPSRGLLAESILRDFLRSVLPEMAKVSQGFVEKDGILSHQCDIVIYDRFHYAPLYSFGDIEVIPSKAVFAVIEVKSNIDANKFGKVLRDCELLNKLYVANKYLFIYNGCKVSTIRNYFYSSYVPKCGREDREFLYDHDNYEVLPDAIISLSPDYYLKKDQCPGDRDMNGYVAYSMTDRTDAEVACVQMFVEKLKEHVCPFEKKECDVPPLFLQRNNIEKDDDLKTLCIKGGFGLYDI